MSSSFHMADVTTASHRRTSGSTSVSRKARALSKIGSGHRIGASKKHEGFEPYKLEHETPKRTPPEEVVGRQLHEKSSPKEHHEASGKDDKEKVGKEPKDKDHCGH
ncbi:hypothetical protein MRX96_043591 [Rhipicephalus microplus]